MAEKGGKGFSLPGNASKPAQKSSGKDDTSVKAKRGRKVQFKSQGSPDGKINFSSHSWGKSDLAMGKGDWGKGGKVGQTANGDKRNVKKDLRPLELHVEGELPQNAQCIMDCEAAHILQGIQEQMATLSDDPTIKIPVSFDRGLQYATSGCNYTDAQSVRQVLQVLTKCGILESEICVIANACPETVDEAFALVPSLKARRDVLSDPLRDALNELSKLKKFA